jgi:dolichol-phosphate mannosyltransferase
MSEEILRQRSMQHAKLSAVVPTYMEKESISELIGRIESSLNLLEFELIIVDDASQDGTAECAENLNRHYGNIIVVKRRGKLGLSSAVLDGFEKAGAEVLAAMDADLQHPPKLLPQMYIKIEEGYDLVIASRHVEGGTIEGWSLRRRILSKGAAFLAHALLPRTRNIKDVMSGFFMFRRSIIEEVKLNPVGFKALLEVIVKGKYDSVAEVPYIFRPRRRGKSRLSLTEVWNYIVHIYRLLRNPS